MQTLKTMLLCFFVYIKGAKLQLHKMFQIKAPTAHWEKSLPLLLDFYYETSARKSEILHNWQYLCCTLLYCLLFVHLSVLLIKSSFLPNLFLDLIVHCTAVFWHVAFVFWKGTIVTVTSLALTFLNFYKHLKMLWGSSSINSFTQLIHNFQTDFHFISVNC